MNGLAHRALIDALYDASQVGVDIDLIVRGVCWLRPEVPGLSGRIRLRSIVGPFLEHSRVSRFGHGERARHYLGSADLMSRNLDGRVEVVVPVALPALAAGTDETLDLCLTDDVLAWRLDGAGEWWRSAQAQNGSAQEELIRRGSLRCDESIA